MLSAQFEKAKMPKNSRLTKPNASAKSLKLIGYVMIGGAGVCNFMFVASVVLIKYDKWHQVANLVQKICCACCGHDDHLGYGNHGENLSEDGVGSSSGSKGTSLHLPERPLMQPMPRHVRHSLANAHTQQLVMQRVTDARVSYVEQQAEKLRESHKELMQDRQNVAKQRLEKRLKRRRSNSQGVARPRLKKWQQQPRRNLQGMATQRLQKRLQCHYWTAFTIQPNPNPKP